LIEKTQMRLIQTKFQGAIPIGKFGRVCGFPPDEARSAALAAFVERLRALPKFTRKLLAQIAGLAYRKHEDARKLGAAYLPELHETCGLGVDEMYVLLHELEDAGFIHMEGDYPFQDVLPAGDPELHWVILRDLTQFCCDEKVPLRDLIVDLRTDLLA
jgi:hypothetical protein